MTNLATSSSSDWSEESGSPTQPTVPVQPVDPRLTSTAPGPRRRKPSTKPSTPPHIIHPTTKPTKSTRSASPRRLPNKPSKTKKPPSTTLPSILSAARLVFGILPYLLAVVSYLLPVLLVGVGTWWVVYYLAPTLAQGLADKALAVPLGLLRVGGGLVGGVSPVVAGLWCSIVDCDRGGDQVRGGVARVVQRRADQVSSS